MKIRTTLKIVYPFILGLFVYLLVDSVTSQLGTVDFIESLFCVSGILSLSPYIYIDVEKAENFPIYLTIISALGVFLMLSIFCLVFGYCGFALLRAPLVMSIQAMGTYPVPSILAFSSYIIILLAFTIYLLSIRYTNFFKTIVFTGKFLSYPSILLLIYLHAFSWCCIDCVDDDVLALAGTCSLFLILLLFFFSYYKRFGLVYHKHYVLYLRSFAKNNNEVFSLIKRSLNLPIYKVGNPRLFSDGSSLFLPGTNWHKYLDYLISRADTIVVNVSSTEGILWEIFEHADYSYKYYFYIEDKEELATFNFHSKAAEKYQDTTLWKTFQWLSSQKDLPRSFFCDNQGNIIHDLSRLCSGKRELQIQDSLDKKQRFKVVYTLFDIRRFFLRNAIKTSSTIGKYLVKPMLIVIFICISILFLLFSLFCLVSGFMIVFFPSLYSEFIGLYLPDTPVARILYGFFTIGLGSYILKRIIKKIKS